MIGKFLNLGEKGNRIFSASTTPRRDTRNATPVANSDPDFFEGDSIDNEVAPKALSKVGARSEIFQRRLYTFTGGGMIPSDANVD